MKLRYTLVSVGSQSVELTAEDDNDIQILTGMIDMSLGGDVLTECLGEMVELYRVRQADGK